MLPVFSFIAHNDSVFRDIYSQKHWSSQFVKFVIALNKNVIIGVCGYLVMKFKVQQNFQIHAKNTLFKVLCPITQNV
jgi:hypothetical protein